MAEAFDPTQIPGADTPEPDGFSIGEALTAQRQAFSGLEDLGVDAVPLEEAESPDVLAALETPPPVPADATPLPVEPVPLPAPSAEVAALQQRLALLEAELAANRAPLAPPPPPQIGEDVLGRVATRFQEAFGSMAEMAEGETDAQFEARRARAFAQSVVSSMYEDLLPTEAFQERLRPMTERIAEERARAVAETTRQSLVAQDQQQTLIRDAVHAARAAGYDAYAPDDPQHATSRDSRLVWGVATQIDPNLSPQQQIAELVSLLPARTPPPVAPPAAPPRPQPMARQGNVPAPTPGADEGPATLNEMMRLHAQQRRIGVA